MSTHTAYLVWTGLWSLALIIGVVGLVRSLKSGRQKRAQLGSNFAKALEDTEIACADMKRQLTEQRAQTEDARKQRDNLVTKIDGIIEERETWRKKYMDESAGAASAQDMMLIAIERLSRQIVKLGAKPQISAALRDVLSEISLADGTPPMTAVKPTQPVTATQSTGDAARHEPVVDVVTG